MSNKWFSHDINMSNNPKIKDLELHFGLVGYAVFIKILEYLAQQDSYKLEYSSTTNKIFSRMFFEKEKKINEIVEKCLKVGLLRLENNLLFSNGLIERLSHYDDIKDKRQKAGKNGGRASAEKRKNTSNTQANVEYYSSNVQTNVENNSSNDEANANEISSKIQPIKGNEIKGNNIKENTTIFNKLKSSSSSENSKLQPQDFLNEKEKIISKLLPIAKEVLKNEHHDSFKKITEMNLKLAIEKFVVHTEVKGKEIYWQSGSKITNIDYAFKNHLLGNREINQDLKSNGNNNSYSKPNSQAKYDLTMSEDKF